MTDDETPDPNTRDPRDEKREPQPAPVEAGFFSFDSGPGFDSAPFDDRKPQPRDEVIK